ncbi:MAG TPA: tetratricopeptide repeat protein [Bacteroidales bacterium]|nr:hypothetical protein [Bacteroidota bacterium]HJN06512.1 tetratricopeptide repeat protein [Bacteroidales bacterium]
MSILKRSLLLVSMVMLTVAVMAQSVEDAGAKYNEGNEFYKEKDYSNAVTAYEAALNTANETGADADDLKGSIEKQLMNAYYKNGLAQYKGRKFDAAIAFLEKGYAFGEKLNDASMKKKTSTYIAKVRTSKGNSLLKSNKINEAFAEYEMATEILPNYPNAYYGKGMVYKAKDDMANMMVNMDKAIELGAGNPKAAKIAKKAKSTTAKALVNAGAKEIQKEHGKKATEYIVSSFNYNPGNAKAYYYLTLAYNNTKNWDKAIEAANKAIGMETDNKSDMYFALGQAYEGKNDAAGACNAYKNVTSGANVEVAKYQITQVLKCS